MSGEEGEYVHCPTGHSPDSLECANMYTGGSFSLSDGTMATAPAGTGPPSHTGGKRAVRGDDMIEMLFDVSLSSVLMLVEESGRSCRVPVMHLAVTSSPPLSMTLRLPSSLVRHSSTPWPRT